MTAATRTRSSSPVLWIAFAAIAALIVLVAFGGRDDASVGGVADPDGTGREGLRALRLLITETGGHVDTGVHSPNSDHDVAVLGRDVYTDYFSEIGDQPDRTFENYRPVLDWVEAGGLLLTGVDVPDGPEAAFSFEDQETTVAPGECTVAALEGLVNVRVLPHSPVDVGGDDTSCFGNGSRALVVVRPFGDGSIVRVANISLFFNQVLDDEDNAALAARLIRLQPNRRVAFLVGPDPAFSNYDGPVNEDGEPIGAGDSGLLDLVPRKVIALIVGLGAAFLLYALARGRRLGSPVLEPLPIELPSSSYVEAVGRLYHRAEAPRARSAAILRDDFRTAAARRIGLPATAPVEDIATALSLASGASKDDLMTLLRDTDPATDEELTGVAAGLSDNRARMTTGGARLDPSPAASTLDQQRKVPQ